LQIDEILIYKEAIMGNSNLNIRMDGSVKEQFEEFCSDLGVSMSTLVNMFIKSTLRERKIVFELKDDPFYSKSNMEHLMRGVKALNEGKGVEHDIIEVD
jgi:DNA-damage-inducible protein J